MGCHLKLKSALFLINLNLKSALLIFGFLWTNLKNSTSALWECGKAVGFSKSLWEVW